MNASLDRFTGTTRLALEAFAPLAPAAAPAELAEATEGDLTRFNGTFTFQSRRTGAHKTLRIRTRKNGTRDVALMQGTDNENDYTSFGFLRDDGSVYFWKEFFGTQAASQVEWMVKTLQAGGHPSVEILKATCCRRCNLKLTNPESVRSGIGPECARKG